MSHPEVNETRSTVTLHVVSSLDGFIARNDNSVSWLDSSGDVYERGIAEDGAAQVFPAIDCFVLGSRTYEHALQLGWPYGETPTIVVTSRPLTSPRTSVEFYSGDLKRMLDERLAARFRSSRTSSPAGPALLSCCMEGNRPAPSPESGRQS